MLLVVLLVVVLHRLSHCHARGGAKGRSTSRRGAVEHSPRRPKGARVCVVAAAAVAAGAALLLAALRALRGVALEPGRGEESVLQLVVGVARRGGMGIVECCGAAAGGGGGAHALHECAWAASRQRRPHRRGGVVQGRWARGGCGRHGWHGLLLAWLRRGAAAATGRGASGGLGAPGAVGGVVEAAGGSHCFKQLAAQPGVVVGVGCHSVHLQVWVRVRA